MFLVKVLEKKSIIRFFGIVLLLAPFFNTFAKMSMLTELPNRWSIEIFRKILISGSTFNQILYVATIIIGFIMLRGSTKAWQSTLILLAGYIVLQISDFGHVRTNWITWLFFITNIIVFLFIADQLVWKVKAAKPTQIPARIAKVRKKILIHFVGIGPWAQLLNISSKGLHVRSLMPPPLDIKNRELEISLKNGLTLRTRLSRSSDQDYFFNYTSLSSEEIVSLNQWILSLS
jgi:hypothetical protein